MQKVPKKKQKSLPKWLVPLGIVLAICVCAGAIYLLRQTPKTELPELVDDYSVKTLFSHQAEEISSIQVTPPNGDSYTLVYKNDTLVLENDETYPLRTSIVDSFLLYATTLEIQSTLLDTAEEAIDLAAYGLSPANIRVVYTYQDGSTITQLLGNLLPIETPEYYCMIEGDSKLYAVSSDVYEAFSVQFSFLHPVTKPSIQSDLIDRITLSGQTDFSAYYTPSGWMMDSPFRYPLDASKMETFLSKLDSLRFSTWVGAAENVALVDYGLDNPRLTMTLDFVPSILTVPDENGDEHTFDLPKSQLSILFGNDISDMTLYTLYDGEVMTGTFFTLGFLTNFDAESLYLKNPINFAANNLSFISYTTADLSAEYNLKLVERLQQNGDFETDEYGNTLYDVWAYRNGTPVDSTAFLRWYQALSQVSAAGRLPDGWAAQDEPVATVQLTNEAGTVTRTVRFYPYNSVYHAIEVDGVALYYTRAAWTETITDLP